MNKGEKLGFGEVKMYVERCLGIGLGKVKVGIRYSYMD